MTDRRPLNTNVTFPKPGEGSNCVLESTTTKFVTNVAMQKNLEISKYF